MENEKELPKENVDSGDNPPQTVPPDENGNCPEGYYYDADTKQCILDVG